MTYSDKLIEVAFNSQSVERLTASLKPGDVLPVSNLLAALDTDISDVMDEVFQQLHDIGVTIDLSDLPRYGADSETALRLRREEALSAQGDLLQSLNEDDPLAVYLRDLSEIPTCGDIRLLAAQLQEANRAGEDASDILANLLNLSLSRIVELAGCYAGKGVLLLDLIQEGSMGLWEMLPRYDSNDFEAFCDHWVNWYMTKAVVSQAYASGVGQKLREIMEDYRSVDERLLSEFGRNPTMQEIAEGLHIGVQEAEAVSTMVANVRKLNHARQTEPEQIPQDEDQAVEDTAYFQMRQRISDLLTRLEPADAELLSLRYGLEGGLPLDPVEVGHKLGISPQEVTQREAAALSILRQ